MYCWNFTSSIDYPFLLHILCIAYSTSERITLNSVMGLVAIPWLDGMDTNKTLFWLLIVPKNIHWSTRFFSVSIKQFLFIFQDSTCFGPVAWTSATWSGSIHWDKYEDRLSDGNFWPASKGLFSKTKDSALIHGSVYMTYQ